MRLEDILDLDKNDYQNIAFPPTGVLHENGLTAPGVSSLYGPAQMWQ
jgi:hypothetical protein